MKTEQLQIRVSLEQKESIRRRAKASGMEMSQWIISQLFSRLSQNFASLISALASSAQSDRFLAFAAINDFLSECDRDDLRATVEHVDCSGLTIFDATYLAAMVESACHQKGIDPPLWVLNMGGLEEPYFGSTLKSLRMHLLVNSPVPFRRRNIFIDSSIGDRV